MNLEPRYVPSDRKEFEAWIFGLTDALEFFQNSTRAINDLIPAYQFERTAAYLATDIITEASKYWRDEFEIDHRGSALSLSERSSARHRDEEKVTDSRPTRTGEDPGGAWRTRRSRRIQERRLARSISAHPAGKRQVGMDQEHQDIPAAEASRPSCTGSWHWFSNEERERISGCPCSAEYSSDNSSS